MSHLEAFRRMLLEILAIFVLLLIPGWYFAGDVVAFLQRAAERSGACLSLHYFALLEPFVVELKAGALLAVGAGMPVFFWRVWHFLAPALYPGERRWIAGGAAAALILFWGGVLLAYFGVVPLLLRFSMSFARDGLTPLIGVESFVTLVLTVCAAFGVMFEFPLLLLLLVALGAVRLETLRKQRALMLVVILILAAVLTPPDVLSQILLAAPCYLLFEATLFLGRFLPGASGRGESSVSWDFPDFPEPTIPENDKPAPVRRRKRTRPAPRLRKRR